MIISGIIREPERRTKVEKIQIVKISPPAWWGILAVGTENTGEGIAMRESELERNE